MGGKRPRTDDDDDVSSLVSGSGVSFDASSVCGNDNPKEGYYKRMGIARGKNTMYHAMLLKSWDQVAEVIEVLEMYKQECDEDRAKEKSRYATRIQYCKYWQRRDKFRIYFAATKPMSFIRWNTLFRNINAKKKKARVWNKSNMPEIRYAREMKNPQTLWMNCERVDETCDEVLNIVRKLAKVDRPSIVDFINNVFDENSRVGRLGEDLVDAKNRLINGDGDFRFASEKDQEMFDILVFDAYSAYNLYYFNETMKPVDGSRLMRRVIPLLSAPLPTPSARVSASRLTASQEKRSRESGESAKSSKSARDTVKKVKQSSFQSDDPARPAKRAKKVQRSLDYSPEGSPTAYGGCPESSPPPTGISARVALTGKSSSGQGVRTLAGSSSTVTKTSAAPPAKGAPSSAASSGRAANELARDASSLEGLPLQSLLARVTDNLKRDFDKKSKSLSFPLTAANIEAVTGSSVGNGGSVGRVPAAVANVSLTSPVAASVAESGSPDRRQLILDFLLSPVSDDVHSIMDESDELHKKAFEVLGRKFQIEYNEIKKFRDISLVFHRWLVQAIDKMSERESKGLSESIRKFLDQKVLSVDVLTCLVPVLFKACKKGANEARGYFVSRMHHIAHCCRVIKVNLNSAVSPDTWKDIEKLNMDKDLVDFIMSRNKQDEFLLQEEELIEKMRKMNAPEGSWLHRFLDMHDEIHVAMREDTYRKSATRNLGKTLTPSTTYKPPDCDALDFVQFKASK